MDMIDIVVGIAALVALSVMLVAGDIKKTALFTCCTTTCFTLFVLSLVIFQLNITASVSLLAASLTTPAIILYKLERTEGVENAI